jgi:DNA-binding response OmpR family regulator
MKRDKPLILVIEDEPTLRADIADELVHHGYNVLEAADGQEGCTTIEQRQPDLIICDINMPVQNGFELLDRIRELGPRYADVPFLFLSALSAPVQVVDGINAGADDYIVKPVDYELLLAKVRAHFGRNERLIKKWMEERLGVGVGGAVIVAIVIIGMLIFLGLVSIFFLYVLKGFLEVEFSSEYHFTDFF